MCSLASQVVALAQLVEQQMYICVVLHGVKDHSSAERCLGDAGYVLEAAVLCRHQFLIVTEASSMAGVHAFLAEETAID